MGSSPPKWSKTCKCWSICKRRNHTKCSIFSKKARYQPRLALIVSRNTVPTFNLMIQCELSFLDAANQKNIDFLQVGDSKKRTLECLQRIYIYCRVFYTKMKTDIERRGPYWAGASNGSLVILLSHMWRWFVIFKYIYFTKNYIFGNQCLISSRG